MNRAELETWLGQRTEKRGKYYFIKCPFHDDNNPSCSIDLERTTFICFGCRVKGGLDYLGKKLKLPPLENIEYKPFVYEKTEDIIIPLAFVDGYVQCLHNTMPQLLNVLLTRVPSLKIIKEYKLGYDISKGRFTIPIIIDGICRDIKYIGIPNKVIKQLSYGGSMHQLFNKQDLEISNKIIIAAGEWDVLVCKSFGFPACCSTKGELSWNSDWNKLFNDKEVYLCFDPDETGYSATQKVGKELEEVAKIVKVVKYDIPTHEKVDISDYFLKYQKTAKEFINILTNASPFQRFSVHNYRFRLNS